MAKSKHPQKLVDFCKVDTNAFRQMTTPQLQRVSARLYTNVSTSSRTWNKAFTIIQNPRRVRGMPERRGLVSNYLVWRYVRELIDARAKRDPAVEQAYRDAVAKRSDGSERPLTFEERQRRQYSYVDKVERAIWTMQQRMGCPIKPREQVARDIIHENRADAAERAAVVRGRRRAKIR